MMMCLQSTEMGIGVVHPMRTQRDAVAETESEYK